MLTLIISGANGRMGQAVSAICEADEKLKIVAGFDPDTTKQHAFPLYVDPMEFGGKADVLIDFSLPASLGGLLQYCVRTKTPAILCTTGYSEADEAEIMNASKSVPIFKSGNMSLGINLLADLIKKAVHILGTDYDIEIVERHHNKKLDAPSGTAYMLADAAREALPFDPDYVYERQSIREPRGPREIGISAVRGGTIVGEHEVIFAGLDEVIELKHTALSRNVFANGAIAAAKYMATVTMPGLYSMNHLISK
ncbi:MAG: 4-hydroxy-tetrahydrodipicolinate reductase [Oscillospiraceae bacterium]|nr:4-hydroxy-tetrahydrodipicolinate reductase [Oscillospiraceae bacterium]